MVKLPDEELTPEANAFELALKKVISEHLGFGVSPLMICTQLVVCCYKVMTMAAPDKVVYDRTVAYFARSSKIIYRDYRRSDDPRLKEPDR